MSVVTKKQTAHTPGPWQVTSGMVETVAEHTCKIEGCGVHIPICHMDRKPGNGTQPTERDANAKLIAAAPELLEALNQIATLWPAPPNCADVLEVIGSNDGKQRAILLHAALTISRAAIRKATGE